MSCSMCHLHHACVSIVPLFSTCSPQELSQLSGITYQKQFKRKESLIPAHHSLSSLIILYEGKAKVVRFDENGNEQILRILTAGDFYGELAILSHEESDVFIEALEDVTACYLDKEQLTPILLSTPSLSMRLLAILAQRLAQSEAKWSSGSTLDSSGKLAYHLLHQMDQSGLVTLSTNKKTLATMLGMSAETLSRVLTQFKNSGWIVPLSPKQYQILNENALLDLTQ